MKEGIDFQKGIKNGISLICNIRYDSDTCVSKAIARRILFVCLTCIKEFDLLYDINILENKQKIYSVNNSSFHWNVLNGLNDWNVLSLTTTHTSNAENNNLVFKTIVKGVGASISKNILSYRYSTMRIYDSESDEYYIVQWRNEPHTLQEDTYIKDF